MVNRRTFLRSVGLIGVAGVSRGASQPVSSPMFQYDAANSGYHPDARLPDGTLAVDWRTELSGQWATTPAVVGDTVYTGASDGTLYALDSHDGSERWRSETNGSLITPPIVRGDAIFAGTGRSLVTAFDRVDGEIRWEFDTELKEPMVPVLYEETIFSTSLDDYLYAFDLDGAVRWNAPVDRLRLAPTAVDADTVYCAGYNFVFAFDRVTGEKRWKKMVRRAHGGATLVDDIVVFPTIAGEVFALDRGDGSTVWKRLLNWGQILAPPAAAYGKVYVGEARASERKKKLTAFSVDDGTTVWERTFDVGVALSPIVAEETVCVGFMDGTVRGFDAASGKTHWRITPGGTGGPSAAITTAPVVTDGSLYVGTKAGEMIAVSGTGSDWTNDLGLVGGALALLGGGAYGAWRKWGRPGLADQ